MAHVAALDDQHHRSSGAVARDHLRERVDVPGGALGDRVRKIAPAIAVHEVTVLHLDVVRRGRALIEEEVHAPAMRLATRPTDLKLTLGRQRAVAVEARQAARLEQPPHQEVGPHGVGGRHDALAVDPHGLDGLPAVLELAVGLCGRQQPHARSRLDEGLHAAGVDAMREDDLLARLGRVVEGHLHHESVAPFEETAADGQRSGIWHEDGIRKGAEHAVRRSVRLAGASEFDSVHVDH